MTASERARLSLIAGRTRSKKSKPFNRDDFPLLNGIHWGGCIIDYKPMGRRIQSGRRTADYDWLMTDAPRNAVAHAHCEQQEGLEARLNAMGWICIDMPQYPWVLYQPMRTELFWHEYSHLIRGYVDDYKAHDRQWMDTFLGLYPNAEPDHTMRYDIWHGNTYAHDAFEAIRTNPPAMNPIASAW